MSRPVSVWKQPCCYYQTEAIRLPISRQDEKEPLAEVVLRLMRQKFPGTKDVTHVTFEWSMTNRDDPITLDIQNAINETFETVRKHYDPVPVSHV